MTANSEGIKWKIWMKNNSDMFGLSIEHELDRAAFKRWRINEHFSIKLVNNVLLLLFASMLCPHAVSCIGWVPGFYLIIPLAVALLN